MSTLGWVHTIFGLLALFAGVGVVSLPKGTRWHRTIGHVYLMSMLSLNISGLFIYNLYGHWGAFHWLALASLITLVLGIIPVLFRYPRKGWLEYHARFMNGSFVGVVAATSAEITSRLPGTEDNFGLVVSTTSLIIIVLGAIWIHLTADRSITNAPARFRKPA